MKSTAAIGALILAPVFVLGSSMAQAATVSYSDFVDGDGTPAFFDAVQTEANASGNLLKIYINNFKADGAAALTYSALDTLAFTITAPAGYVITNVKYVEEGQGATTSGVALATGSMVVAGAAYNFLTQLFQANQSSGWSITAGSSSGIDVPNLEVVPVSIVNSLFAVGYSGGSATIEKTGASLEVSVALIPLPPSVWLLGSALFGVGVLGRRIRGLKAA